MIGGGGGLYHITAKYMNWMDLRNSQISEVGCAFHMRKIDSEKHDMLEREGYFQAHTNETAKDFYLIHPPVCL
jgi:hypothetical protein